MRNYNLIKSAAVNSQINREAIRAGILAEQKKESTSVNNTFKKLSDDDIIYYASEPRYRRPVLSSVLTVFCIAAMIAALTLGSMWLLENSKVPIDKEHIGTNVGETTEKFHEETLDPDSDYLYYEEQIKEIRDFLHDSKINGTVINTGEHAEKIELLFHVLRIDDDKMKYLTGYERNELEQMAIQFIRLSDFLSTDENALSYEYIISEGMNTDEQIYSLNLIKEAGDTEKNSIDGYTVFCMKAAKSLCIICPEFSEILYNEFFDDISSIGDQNTGWATLERMTYDYLDEFITGEGEYKENLDYDDPQYDYYCRQEIAALIYALHEPPVEGKNDEEKSFGLTREEISQKLLRRLKSYKKSGEYWHNNFSMICRRLDDYDTSIDAWTWEFVIAPVFSEAGVNVSNAVGITEYYELYFKNKPAEAEEFITVQHQRDLIFSDDMLAFVDREDGSTVYSGFKWYKPKDNLGYYVFNSLKYNGDDLSIEYIKEISDIPSLFERLGRFTYDDSIKLEGYEFVSFSELNTERDDIVAFRYDAVNAEKVDMVCILIYFEECGIFLPFSVMFDSLPAEEDISFGYYIGKTIESADIYNIKITEEFPQYPEFDEIENLFWFREEKRTAEGEEYMKAFIEAMENGGEASVNVIYRTYFYLNEVISTADLAQSYVELRTSDGIHEYRTYSYTIDAEKGRVSYDVSEWQSFDSIKTVYVSSYSGYQQGTSVYKQYWLGKDGDEFKRILLSFASDEKVQADKLQPSIIMNYQDSPMIMRWPLEWFASKTSEDIAWIEENADHRSGQIAYNLKGFLDEFQRMEITHLYFADMFDAFLNSYAEYAGEMPVYPDIAWHGQYGSQYTDVVFAEDCILPEKLNRYEAEANIDPQKFEDVIFSAIPGLEELVYSYNMIHDPGVWDFTDYTSARDNTPDILGKYRFLQSKADYVNGTVFYMAQRSDKVLIESLKNDEMLTAEAIKPKADEIAEKLTDLFGVNIISEGETVTEKDYVSISREESGAYTVYVYRYFTDGLLVSDGITYSPEDSLIEIAYYADGNIKYLNSSVYTARLNVTEELSVKGFSREHLYHYIIQDWEYYGDDINPVCEILDVYTVCAYRDDPQDVVVIEYTNGSDERSIKILSYNTIFSYILEL